MKQKNWINQDVMGYKMGKSIWLQCRWTLQQGSLEYRWIDDRQSLKGSKLKDKPSGKMTSVVIVEIIFLITQFF